MGDEGGVELGVGAAERGERLERAAWPAAGSGRVARGDPSPTAAAVPEHRERRRRDPRRRPGTARPRPSGAPAPRGVASLPSGARGSCAAARRRPRGGRRRARPSTGSGGRRRRSTGRRRRRCRRPAGRDVVPHRAHDLEAGVEQPPHLAGVRRPAAWPASAARCGRRRRRIAAPELRSASSRIAILRQATTGGRTWHGTSRPTPSSRRSWTGPTRSCGRRSSRSTCCGPGLEFTPPDDTLRKVIDPLKEEVRAPGPVGHPPRPRARRPGLRPAEAVAAERDPRPLVVGADRLRLPGARHRQRRDHRPLRHARAEGALPAAAARGRDLLLLLDDRAPRRRRPDACSRPAPCKDGDEWVINGWKFFSSNATTASFLIVMAVTDPDVSAYQGMSMFLVPTDTPGVEHRPQRRPRRRAAGEGSHALIHYEDVRVPDGRPARRRGPGVRHRPDPPRRRAHPPRHAHHRPGPEGARHDVRAGAQPGDAGQPPRRQAVRAGLHRRLLRPAACSSGCSCSTRRGRSTSTTTTARSARTSPR